MTTSNSEPKEASNQLNTYKVILHYRGYRTVVVEAENEDIAFDIAYYETSIYDGEREDLIDWDVIKE